MKSLLLFMFVAVALADQESDTSQESAARTLAREFRMDPMDSLECVHKSGATMEDILYAEDVIHLSDTEATDMKRVKKASCAMVCCAQKIGVMVGGVVQLKELYKFFQEIGTPEDVDSKLRVIVGICKKQVTETSDECMAYYNFSKCMYKISQTMV